MSSQKSNKTSGKKKKKNSYKIKFGKKKKDPNAKPKGKCFHCGKEWHWKCNCNEYLELVRKQKCVSNIQGIFMMDILSTVIEQMLWVLDTGSPSHICTDMQGLKNSRRIMKGDMNIKVGNVIWISKL